MGRQWLRCAAAAVVAMGVGARALAAVSIVNNGDLQQSTLSATAYDGNSGFADSKSVSVTALPSTPTVTATQGLNTSTVTGNLTQSAFNIGMTQFISVVNPFGETTGTADLFFTSTSDLTFSASGNFVTQAGGGVGQVFIGDANFGMSLFDVTTKTTVFDDQQFGNIGGTLTVATKTGSIVAGHVYEFVVDAGMFPIDDPTGIVTASINFVPVGGPTPPGGGGGSGVPLPKGVWAGMLTVGGVLGAGKLRRKAVVA